MDECGEDNVFNRLQTDLQNVLNFECVCSAPHGRFVESYIRQESSLHIHNVIRFGGGSLNLCTILQSSPTIGILPPFTQNQMMVLRGFGESDVKVSVSVDVRQIGDEFHNVRSSGSHGTSIRLHTLDECERTFGNARKNAIRTVVNGLLGSGEPKREQAVITPFGGQNGTTRIELDEIECQVVKGGPELIDNLPGIEGDFGGG